MAQEQAKKEIPNILILDDVETNRFILRDIIQEMGCRPILTENGVQALKVIERKKPQLVISDVAMPEMDGYEFCQKMKENPDTREIPIIFISAFDDPSDVVKGFTMGGEDYITKPFIPEVVKARVGMHLKLAKATSEMQEMNRLLQTSIGDQLRQIETEKKNVLYALTRVARENASYDEDHMERLAKNCRILAQAMQLSSDFDHLISDSYIETIELAAPLCDLGNVAIPTETLRKQEPLSEKDRLAIQKHVSIGARILRDIEDVSEYNDFIKMSKEIAHYHHENWDGSGYPQGISGNDIPLSAQIVALVSAYCALTEKRTYHQPVTPQEAIEELKKDMGIKYDERIFQILSKIYRQLI